MKVSQSQNAFPETSIELYVNYLKFKFKKCTPTPNYSHLMKYLNVTTQVIPLCFVVDIVHLPYVGFRSLFN